MKRNKEKMTILLACIVVLCIHTACDISTPNSGFYPIHLKSKKRIQNEMEIDKFIKKNMTEYVSGCSLMGIEIEYIGCDELDTQIGNYKFVYEKMLNEKSGEGGYISQIVVHYSGKDNTIKSAEVSNGNGKQLAYGWEELEINNWTTTINEALIQFVYKYQSEISTIKVPIVKVQVVSNILIIDLFEEGKNGYIVEEKVPLIS